MNATPATGVDEAIGHAPRSLVLCASPQRLTDDLLLTLAGRVRPVDGIGVLTGLDPSAVLALASRSERPPLASRSQTQVTAARAENPSAHWTAEIRQVREGAAEVRPLTRDGFREALRSSSAVSFSGHGSPEYLRFGRDPDVLFTGTDVPPRLPPVIVTIASCQTFRFWGDPKKSVALALARSGAAAFVGFAYSPVEGFLPGQIDGAPALASHPGFPLGRVVRLLNEATERRFARIPFLFLLGDPELAAQPDGPEVVRVSAREFLVRGGARPGGWIAFSLPAAEPRGFLALRQADAVLSRVPFSGGFHKDLVVAAREGAVDVLARVPEGEVTVVLTTGSPAEAWAWAGLQSLDYALPFMTASHGFAALLAPAAIWLAGLLLLARNRVREVWLHHRAVLLAGALLAVAAYLAYCALRWPQVAVTTKDLRFAAASILVPAAVGPIALLTRFAVTRRGWSGVLGALAAAFPWLGAGIFLAAVVAGGNGLIALHIGWSIWSFGTATPLLVAGLLIGAVAWPFQSLLLAVERRWNHSAGRSRISPEGALADRTSC